MINKINPKNIDSITLPEIIGLDCEFTSLDVKNANLVVISVNDYENKTNYAFDTNSGIYTDKQIVTLLMKISKCKTVIAHNSKAEIGIIFSNYNILLRNMWCTMMASQVIDNGYGYQIAKDVLVGTEHEACGEKIYFTKNMVGNIHMMTSPHGLHGVIKRYLNTSLSNTMDKKALQMSFVGFPLGKPISQEQMEYACSDVEYLFPLYLKQCKFIAERALEQQINIENRLTPTLVKMEHTGCLIDITVHIENVKVWKDKLYEIECGLDKILTDLSNEFLILKANKCVNKRVRHENLLQKGLFDSTDKVIVIGNKNNINYSSSNQIEEVFNMLQLPVPTDDEGKTSFGEEPLKMYMTNHPNSILRGFLALLLDYREYSKLLSTYGENFLELVDNESRMRTNYTQCFTDTGRLTSSAIIKDKLGLNLSNIPKRADMRKVFIPDPGYSFVDSDMTGQELITVASYSKEPILLKAFKEGFDHHSFLASISYSIIFGEKVEIVNADKEIVIGKYKYNAKKLRDQHKAALFSKIYLGGPKRILNILSEYLSNHVNPSNRLTVATEISNALDGSMPSLMKHLKKAVTEVKKRGYAITTKLGRRRYFDYPDRAYGDAANFDIQSTGSMAIKVALINIDKWYEQTSKKLGIEERELGWISMSIYDQNLCCLNDKYIHLAPEIQAIMAQALTYFLAEGLIGASDLNIRKQWGK